MENDPFQYVLSESEQPAAPEFVCSLREKLQVIRERYPHTQSTVDSCLAGIAGTPTLGRILVAAYVLNGGVSLKFKLGEERARDQRAEADDFERILREISENLDETGLGGPGAEAVNNGATSEPVTEPASEPVTEPASEPVIEPASEPEPQPLPDSPASPVIQAAALDPLTTQAPDLPPPVSFERTESMINRSRALQRHSQKNTGLGADSENASGNAPEAADWHMFTLQ